MDAPANQFLLPRAVANQHQRRQPAAEVDSEVQAAVLAPRLDPDQRVVAAASPAVRAVPAAPQVAAPVALQVVVDPQVVVAVSDQGLDARPAVVAMPKISRQCRYRVTPQRTHLFLRV